MGIRTWLCIFSFHFSEPSSKLDQSVRTQLHHETAWYGQIVAPIFWQLWRPILPHFASSWPTLRSPNPTVLWGFARTDFCTHCWATLAHPSCPIWPHLGPLKATEARQGNRSGPSKWFELPACTVSMQTQAKSSSSNFQLGSIFSVRAVTTALPRE